MGDMTPVEGKGKPIGAAADAAAAEAPENIIEGLTGAQKKEAEAFALEFLKTVIRLRGVRIDRAQFLRAELHKRGVGSAEIGRAISETPVVGGVPLSLLDEIALDSVRFETRKSSALSFAAGLPGGGVMLATIPGDITQFYVHAFRVMQKLAYLYGWQSLIPDAEAVDDETLGKLASLLGVMLGVTTASFAVTTFASHVAKPAVEKHIAKVALTKTAWYGPMKEVLRVVGVRVTKQTFASTAAKAVPVVGGVVSGGMTMVSLDTQSKRLMRHLRKIPPPNVDSGDYLDALRRADEENPKRTRSFGEALGNGMSGAVDTFRSVDLDGDGIPDEARAKTAAKGAASSLRSGVAGARSRLRRPGKKTTGDEAGDGKTPDTDDRQGDTTDAGQPGDTDGHGPGTD